MGFLSGRATFRRFKVTGPAPKAPTEDDLAKLAENAAGRSRMLSGDGVESGWTAGGHVLDTDFDWGKNVLDDALLFGFRTDAVRLPADLLKSYYQIDLAALANDNPSGHPSARQKREAKESARDRLEQEAKDGRYTKRKVTEVLWDLKANELLFGTTSAAQVDRLLVLFKGTFGYGFEAVTAGRLAYALAEQTEQTRAVDDASPSPFIPGLSPADVCWVPDEASRDFLGNELLLWLWFQCDEGGSTVKLADGSEAITFFSHKLMLDCPRGMTGTEAFAFEGPTRMPEALRGIQSGKMPRKAGLTLVRHDVQAEAQLLAEDLAWVGVKLPAPEEEGEDARRSARLEQVREFVRTGDLLFGAFLAERLGPGWAGTVKRIGKWLARERVGAAA